MLRRDFIKMIGASIGVMSLGCGCAGNNKSTTKRPNIVLVVSDDQGYGDFECFGNRIVKTPNLNRLYAQSACFDNFYVSPVCSPTRASLMTGRYNYRTGVWDTWKSRMNMFADETTVAEVLRDNGYKTGIFGKWHLGENYPSRPMDQGFGKSLGFYGTHSRFDPVMELDGKLKECNGFLTDIIFDEAVNFISENRDKNFFAYVSTFMPHDFPGRQVPDEYIEPYSGIESLSDADKQTYAMVACFDKNLGRLLEAIKKLRLEDDTVVIFLSDNGPDLAHPARGGQGEHPPRYNMGLRAGKGTVYEGGIRVPCFVYWPKVTAPGAKIGTIAAHIDIMPTILEICGIDSEGLKLDGVSLTPLLTGSRYEHSNRSLFFQFQRAQVPDMWTNCCVREQDFKLVNGSELYDITNDPQEKYDISTRYPDKVTQMRDDYVKWFGDVTAERRFTGERIVLGSEKQPSVRLKYWDQSEKGWPVEVVNESTYQISVTEIQTGLLRGGAYVEVRIDENLICQSEVALKQGEVVFKNIKLPLGRGFLKVSIIGLEKRILPYGDEDTGYRFVFVEKV